MTNSLTTKAISAILAVCATTASFAEVTHARTYDFKYTAAEMQTAEGQTQLADRMRKFARSACAGISPLHSPAYRKQCREDIEQQIRDQVFADDEPAGL